MKGLSICIPIYHWDVRSLVHELLLQLERSSWPSEILLIDDASALDIQKKNRQLADIDGIRYIELEFNVGRARIRNRLAVEAVHQTLLFMDCDSQVPDERFIARYTQTFSNDHIRCGGTSYSPEVPPVHERLRWVYGRSRESLSASQRSKSPFSSFRTHSFLIPKSVMLANPFSESLTSYGHEDTLFGLELEKAGVDIAHIDNPLLHVGIEDSQEFLRKSLEAIDTLISLYHSGRLTSGVRLLDTFLRLKRLGLDRVIDYLWRKRRASWEEGLLGERPDLKTFDLYRLGYLCHRDRSRV